MIDILLIGLQIIGAIFAFIFIVVFIFTLLGENIAKTREQMNEEILDLKKDMDDYFDIEFSSNLRFPFALLKYIGTYAIISLIPLLLYGPYMLGIKIRINAIEAKEGMNNTVNKILYKDNKDEK